MDTSYIAQVLDNENKVRGTAFLLSDKYLLTCAHVVNYVFGYKDSAQEKPEQCFPVNFLGIADSKTRVRVYKNYWYPQSATGKAVADIALLEIIDPLPEACNAQRFCTLPSASGLKDKSFYAHGFPEDTSAEERIARGMIDGQLGGIQWLQVKASTELTGHHIQSGFSGAPAMLDGHDSIIGMIAAYDNHQGRREGFIIPVECLYQALGLPENWLEMEKTLTAIELFELTELLAGTKVSPKTITAFLKDFLPDCQPKASLDDFLGFLAQRPQHSSDDAPVFEFLEYIAASITEDIGDWKKAVAARLSINPDTVKARVTQQQQVQAENAPEQPAIIFLEIEPEGWTSTDRFKLKTAYSSNGETSIVNNSNVSYSLEELEEKLPDILDEIQQQMETDAQIEIILPLCLFNWNINQIKTRVSRAVFKAIGEDYAFNIRSWDRIRNYEKIYRHKTQNLWAQKWRMVLKQHNINENQISDVSDNHICCKQLLRQMETDILVFIPTFKLSSLDEASFFIFDTAIAAGLPFFFWMPKSQVDENTFKLIVEELLGCCDAEQWMPKIQSKKQQNPLWNDLMVLWDNPQRPAPKIDAIPDNYTSDL